MNDETLARLRAAADREFPQAWIPEQPGDELAGTVTAVRPAVRTAYGPMPVVEVEQLGTRAAWSVWLIHTVMRREFTRHRPTLGETVLVRYLGRVQPEGGGAPYESYRLVVDRPDENSDVDLDGGGRRLYRTAELVQEGEAPAR
jgi:hypothetical protein